MRCRGGLETTITISNMAIWGTRGVAIVEALRAKVRSGARVRVTVGPPTSAMARNALRASPKVPYRLAYEAGCKLNGDDSVDCKYTHMKSMTATWVDGGGTRQYRTWTGSDNWGNGSLDNDEVTQKIGSKAAYDQYKAYLDRLWGASRSPS